MLDSERVQTLPVDARWLYVTVLLTADDVGLFEVSAFKLARRAGLDQKSMPVLTQLLADVDLIRLYRVDEKQFGFIPRFRQRLQIKRTKHPLPPVALMSDDQDAISKINNLGGNPRLDNGSPLLSTAAQPSEPEPEPEKEKAPTVLVGHGVSNPPKARAYAIPDCPYAEIIEAYHAVLPSLPAVVIDNEKRRTLIRGRWREVCGAEQFGKADGVSFFGDFFRIVAASKFLTGRTDQKGRDPFVADLEWLMRPTNFAKTLEGRYAAQR